VRKQLLMAAALAGFLLTSPPAASLPDPDSVFTRAAPEPPKASSTAAPAFAAHLRLRHTRAERRRHESRAAVSPELQAIAACESHGNPKAVGGGGAFRGKYQFDYGTWASVGGEGDPAAAPESEQDMRAAMLLQRAGTSPWPNCG
jgi:hypothetical protein